MTFKHKDLMVSIEEQTVTVTKLINNKPATLRKELDKDISYSKFFKILNNLVELDDKIFISFID